MVGKILDFWFNQHLKSILEINIFDEQETESLVRQLSPSKILFLKGSSKDQKVIFEVDRDLSEGILRKSGYNRVFSNHSSATEKR